MLNHYQSSIPLPIYRECLLMLSVLPCLDLQNGLFPSCCPTKTLHALELSTIRATCPAHLDLLHLIVRTIFGEQYRSWGFSLCNFLPLSCYLVLRRSKYPPQRPFLKDPQSTFLPQYESPSFIPIQNNGRNYIFVYFIRIFLDASPSGRAV